MTGWTLEDRVVGRCYVLLSPYQEPVDSSEATCKYPPLNMQEVQTSGKHPKTPMRSQIHHRLHLQQHLHLEPEVCGDDSAYG